MFQYWYPWPFLGRFLPGFACSTLMFWFLISLFLPLFFLFPLPKSKFEILWLKITFVFQCSWYVPSLLNFLYLTVSYLDIFFLSLLFKTFHKCAPVSTEICSVFLPVILVLSLISVLHLHSYCNLHLSLPLVFLTISEFLEFPCHRISEIRSRALFFPFV